MSSQRETVPTRAPRRLMSLFLKAPLNILKVHIHTQMFTYPCPSQRRRHQVLSQPVFYGGDNVSVSSQVQRQLF